MMPELHIGGTRLSHSRLGLIPDGAGRDLRLARGLAALRRLAPVNAAGKAIDQPDIILRSTLQADKSGSHRCHQRGQQDRSGNDGRSDQYRYRDAQISGHDGALPLILVSFWCLKRGQFTTLALLGTQLDHNAIKEIRIMISSLFEHESFRKTGFHFSGSCSRDPHPKGPR